MAKKNEKELYLFHQGTYYCAYEFLGAHPHTKNRKKGYIFRTWAPNATKVCVVGDFNKWDNTKNPMTRISKEGVWEVFIENVQIFQKYKFEITDKKGFARLKADPYGFMQETNGKTASIVYDIEGYEWGDEKFLEYRLKKNNYESPMNIYEVNFIFAIRSSC